MCVYPKKYIKLPKWSCVLNVCSECTGAFAPDTKISGDKDMDRSLIFCRYENMSCGSLHNQLLPEKPCMNLETFDKGKVTTRKILVL